MSMRVLIVPEDVRKDQYLLKPLFDRLFRSLRRSTARVEVCQDPRLGGVGEALKTERLAEIVEQYRGMTDLFILCVDRDGDVNRRQRLDWIEGKFDHGKGFLAENAWEELETWTLAGLTLPDEWRWDEVRAAVDVKERYFDELARRRGLSDAPGAGASGWARKPRTGLTQSDGSALKTSTIWPGGSGRFSMAWSHEPAPRRAPSTSCRGTSSWNGFGAAPSSDRFPRPASRSRMSSPTSA